MKLFTFGYMPHWIVAVGLEPAMLIGFDWWQSHYSGQQWSDCINLYLGPFVISLYF